MQISKLQILTLKAPFIAVSFSIATYQPTDLNHLLRNSGTLRILEIFPKRNHHHKLFLELHLPTLHLTDSKFIAYTYLFFSLSFFFFSSSRKHTKSITNSYLAILAYAVHTKKYAEFRLRKKKTVFLCFSRISQLDIGFSYCHRLHVYQVPTFCSSLLLLCNLSTISLLLFHSTYG